MKKIKLSEDIKYWRAERPDEWTMDEFVLAADNAESSSMEVRIPKGFYNIGISCDHHIYGDTNDSANWNRFEIPLKTPKGKWIITKHEKLEDCELLELTDR